MRFYLNNIADKLISNILFPLQNCNEIGLRICKLLNINIAETSILKDITEHPNYPSLLSISDTLRSYNVDTLPIKTSHIHLSQLPTPFIAQVTGHSFDKS